ncbi:MAG: cereblon family protein [Vulcanimicrobiota bacterium]
MILCKQCYQVVTHPEAAIQVAGKHEHTFRNPAGYSFHVLCFSQAPGALESGEPTSEACWFAGYAWSFAVCLQCHHHLGWWYRGQGSFAGLIATRLIQPPPRL